MSTPIQGSSTPGLFSREAQCSPLALSRLVDAPTVQLEVVGVVICTCNESQHFVEGAENLHAPRSCHDGVYEDP